MTRLTKPRKTIYETITNAPEPGAGLSISDAQPESLTLSWEKATDNGIVESALYYSVFFSENNNIGTNYNLLIANN